MHDIKLIRENPEKFLQKISERNSFLDIKKLLNLDKQNRKLIQDKEKLEQIDLKNQAETTCYQAKKLLESSETPEVEKAKIEGLVSELEAAIAKEDYTAMKDLMAQYTSMQTASASSAGGASSDPSSDDVIDTDFSAEK